MTIAISNLSMNHSTPSGAVVGVLSAYDNSGLAIPCNFTLTQNSTGFFGISGNNLMTERASISAGVYSVRVRAVGTNTRFSGNAVFNVLVA